MVSFHVAVRKERDHDYEIEVPDLPGCKITVKSCSDIQQSTKHAIEEHCEQLSDNGTDSILLRSFQELVSLPEYSDVTWHLIYNVNIGKMYTYCNKW